MNINQVMSIVFIIGGVLGFAALGLSLLFHKVDGMMGRIEWTSNSDGAIPADEQWHKLNRIREPIRALGLVCLYGGLVAMAVGALGMGLLFLEQV